MDTLSQRLVARHGGMDMAGMNMGQSNSTSAMMMSTYFTTSLGASNLWFSSWTPTTAGSTFGACLGLFFLAILSRFLAAVKSCAEVAWAQSLERQHSIAAVRSSRVSDSTKTNKEEEEEDTSEPRKTPSNEISSILPSLVASTPARVPPPPPASSSSSTSSSSSRRPAAPFTPPFYLSIDLPRSILFGLQSFVAYLLMLAVMSYSAYFFISILIGLMVGELAFGRFIVLLGGGALGGHHGAEHL